MKPSVPIAKAPRDSQMRAVSDPTMGRPSRFRSLFLQSLGCYSESGKGDEAIESAALGLLKPGMKRSQTPAFTVPYVV